MNESEVTLDLLARNVGDPFAGWRSAILDFGQSNFLFSQLVIELGGVLPCEVIVKLLAGFDDVGFAW